MERPDELVGRLVLPDRIAGGRIVLDGSVIAAVDLDDADAPTGGPLFAPGFVDVHVHGWGGHDAMGGPDALSGMARALRARGVTSFLPTAFTAALETLRRFADDVREFMADAPSDGAEPLGSNLEGPFLAEARKGAHDAAHLVDPADVAPGALEPLLDGLRMITIAPERPGALELIATMRARGVTVSLGHSASSLEEARAGYTAGATTTTHLFNGMTGLDRRTPGLAAAALLDDERYVELIADGHHVHPALWPLIARLKPSDRLLLVSDALQIAGTDARRATIGGVEVEVADGRVTLLGTTTLAGSVIALDGAVRNLVGAGASVPAAVAAASANPAAMLGRSDRGRIAVGQRADLVELGDDLSVRRVMRAGRWIAGGAADR